MDDFFSMPYYTKYNPKEFVILMLAEPPLVRNVADLYQYSRTADIVPSPAALTDADFAFYHRDGFLAVADVLTPQEVEQARAALRALLHGEVAGYTEQLQPEPEWKEKWPSLTADERADTVRKLWKFVDFEPTLRAFASHPVLQSILTRLTGESCDLIQDMALLKPPFLGSEKPWHQDMAYFSWGPPEKVLGVWIALDSATPENGCMHVLPGTQNDGPVAHTHLRDCQIPDESVQVERDVLVPLAPGGALFFASLLHHGTPPNASPNRRWALQYHYKAHSARPVSRRDHADLFFAGDLYAGCRGKMGEPVAQIEP